MRGRSAHILTVLALVLPVPLCAALGLSLPLPATVARIAAKLVPFANSAVLNANEEQLLGARGSIVRVPGEPAGSVGSAIDPGGSLTAHSPRSAGGGGIPGGKVDGSTTASPKETATNPAAGEHGSSTPRPTGTGAGSTSPGSTPTGGGSDPVPPNAPPTVIDTVTGAPATVMGTVSNTATTATSTVAETAAAAVTAAGAAVPPVLPKP
ncbi:MAG: hypothetical protein M3R37_05120 [Actinomycetota bacterium]|nr:hypothetical protein [Actinomycetota bacterium]